MSGKPLMLIFDDDDFVELSAMGKSIDDFAVSDASSVHLERMEGSNYCMVIELANGKSLRFWIGHKNPRARVNAYMEVE